MTFIIPKPGYAHPHQQITRLLVGATLGQLARIQLEGFKPQTVQTRYQISGLNSRIGVHRRPLQGQINPRGPNAGHRLQAFLDT
ncbi:MAG: hypothetical protein ACI9VX_000600 [Dinoroseobacter sp.]|jgi:hypothetical protein